MTYIAKTTVVRNITTSDLSNPTELVDLTADQDSTLLVAYNSSQEYTIYAWTSSTITADAPYVMAGSTGYWTAIGGKYSTFPYMIPSVPGADHTARGMISSFTAGENLVFGNVVYVKSDGYVWKADATDSSTCPCMGMAIATINASAAGNILLQGIARDDTWTWTVGGVVYLSITAGSMTQVQPSATDEVIQVLGIATHADRMYFNPSMDYITHT